MIRLYPYPYKAWLALANDPDNTTPEGWKELHQFIWEELQLPFADSLFIRSFNQNLPNQVNLVDHPEIASAHAYDTIHTWGDYMHAQRRGFNRKDAVEGIEILKKHGIQPRVWIDHAQFEGNLLHNSKRGGVPTEKDASGHVYRNFMYTLDHIQKLGIHYVWTGTITEGIGQDRKISAQEFMNRYTSSKVKLAVKILLYKMTGLLRAPQLPDNRQYFAKEFADGSTMYCFLRYGTWKDADIYGLGNILEASKIEALLNKGGTAAVYTHLGKRPIDKMDESRHIPEKTRNALRYLASKYEDRQLMISPLHQMLDYLVIRDHIQIDVSANTIAFKADGIRYQTLTETDMKDMKFSFADKGFNRRELNISVDDAPVRCRLMDENEQIFSLIF